MKADWKNLINDPPPAELGRVLYWRADMEWPQIGDTAILRISSERYRERDEGYFWCELPELPTPQD
jgi:hypothetical protein